MYSILKRCILVGYDLILCLIDGMIKSIDTLLKLKKYQQPQISQSKLERMLLICLTITKEFTCIPGIIWSSIWWSLWRASFDERSDIEIYIYYAWDLLEKNILETLITKKLKAKLTRSDSVHRYHKARWFHSFFELDGISIELWYRNIDEVRAKIDNFNKEFLLPQHWLHDSPFWHYHSWLLSCISEWVIIFDTNNQLLSIQDWLQVFPPKIREETIKYYFNDALFLLNDKVKTAWIRKDIYLFHSCVSRIIRSLTILVFSLNGKYYPGDKRNEKYLQGFKNIPESFTDTIHDLYNSFNSYESNAYHDSITLIESLILEHEDMISNLLPNIILKIPNLEN